MRRALADHVESRRRHALGRCRARPARFALDQVATLAAEWCVEYLVVSKAR